MDFLKSKSQRADRIEAHDLNMYMVLVSISQ